MFTRNLLGWLLDRQTDKSTNHPDRQFRDRLQVLTNLRDREEPLRAAMENVADAYTDVIIAARQLRYYASLERDDAEILDGHLVLLREAVEAARKAVRS